MTINSIGSAGYANSVALSVSSGSKSSEYTSAGSQGIKDTATISDTARELAAQNAGQNSQEEATESISEKMRELVSGTD